MKFGIVVFPGSNCEKDCHDAITHHLGEEALYLWHDDRDLKGVDAILLPGGFSYGDYLRSGAIARFSPVMESVKAFSDKGGPVLGICNGFQILTESGLLPGTLSKNRTLKFHCDQVQVRVENNRTPFTTAYQAGSVLTLPVAHAEGNFMADPEEIQRLEDNQQVVFRYVEDINGSMNNIAGIINERGNVLGLMPHPERNLWARKHWTGEGRGVFDSLLAYCAGAVGV